MRPSPTRGAFRLDAPLGGDFQGGLLYLLLGRQLTRHDYPLPVWPWPSGNQILRIGVIGLGLTRRLSHSRGKVPLEGYGTIAGGCYIFHTIGRARCGDWPLRMSRSLTGRIGWCIGRIKGRFTEQGCFFQFILGGSAGVQLVKCQKSMETGAGNRGVNLLSLQIGIPEIMGWRVGRP